MITERHNAAGRLVLKAISKGALGGCLVAADVGRADKLPGALEGVAGMRSPPAWLGLGTVGRSTSRPDGILVVPTGSDGPYAGVTAPLQSLRPDEYTVHLVEIKYCPDTRVEDQLARADDQHAALREQLERRGSQVVQTTVLLGAGGTVYKQHTVDALRTLGVNGERLLKITNKLNRLAADWAASIIGTRRKLETNRRPQAPGRPAAWRDSG